MKFKDDFKTQAGISRAIAWEMTSHQQYFDLLEARLPVLICFTFQVKVSLDNS